MASIYNIANGLRAESGNPNCRMPNSRFSPQNVNNTNFGPRNVDFGPDVFLTNEVHEINEFGKPLNGGFDGNSDTFKYSNGLSEMRSPWKSGNNMNMMGNGYPNQNGLQYGSEFQQSNSGFNPFGGPSPHQGHDNFKNNYGGFGGGNNGLGGGNNGLGGGRNHYNYNSNSEEQNMDYSYGGFGF